MGAGRGRQGRAQCCPEHLLFTGSLHRWSLNDHDNPQPPSLPSSPSSPSSSAHTWPQDGPTNRPHPLCLSFQCQLPKLDPEMVSDSTLPDSRRRGRAADGKMWKPRKNHCLVLWTDLCPPNPHTEAPIPPNVTVLGNKVFKQVIKLK